MNCLKCSYIKRITKNPHAKCMVHGFRLLMTRFEKRQLTGLKPARIK